MFDPQRRSSPRPPARRESAPPPGSESWLTPWVQIKYFTFHPNIFPNMIAATSPDAKCGDVVTVYDRDGFAFGHALFNPAARVPLRVFQHGVEPIADDFLTQRLRQAVELRLRTLRLAEQTDAFRVMHSDGDGIPGLVIDKYDDVLSIETTTVAAHQRVREWLPMLHEMLGTKRQVIHFDEIAMHAEDAQLRDMNDYTELQSNVREVRLRENGVRFAVNFESGHKTGFFCDQRDNRKQFAQWAQGRVLDVCCYTGGFGIAAKVLGNVDEVTGVDLDEKSIEQAKRNANLNEKRMSFVHADAFSYMRQMQTNGATWDTVVLDPPKLIRSKEGFDEGKAKYHDLNKLALSLVARGGLFLTCSCSGQMIPEMFEEIIIGLAHRNGRKLQILDRTGAGADHPVMSNCPESRYLKTLWARVW